MIREPFADVPIAVIDPRDIAEVAVLALTSGGHDHRGYRLTGPQPLLPADRVRVLGEVLGRDLRLEAEPDSDARRRLSAAMPDSMADAFFQFFRRGGYDDSGVNDTVTRLLRRPARTFDEWAAAHADAFR